MKDADHVLVFNAGSSSLKFELFAVDDSLRSRVRGSVDGIGRSNTRFRLRDSEAEQAPVSDHAEAAGMVLARLSDGVGDVALDSRTLRVSGHRIVHGGDAFSAPVTVTQEVFGRLESAAQLAPLHNPPALAVMRAVRSRLADVPMVAAFDTAFFRDLPETARAYAVPNAWRKDYGVRRYGFHGIAHEYLHERFRLAGSAKRVVSLHLGQGCSATALDDGRPVETSMGFTPLEGLIMGTRPGDLDSGVLLHLARQGLSWEALDDVLNTESGLLGLSGASDDVRKLLELEAEDHAGARLALSAFCRRIHKYLGAYAAVLGGIEALLFGGGIGENAPVIRSRICEGLCWLGLELDEEMNERCRGIEDRISRPSSKIAVHVIPVREEQAIARAAVACVRPRNETRR